MSTVKVDIRQLSSYLSARQISVMLTIVALILLSYSITQAELKVGFFGLIYSFPIIFFVALVILTIASAIIWFSRQNHWKLLLLQLSVLVIATFLIPTIVGNVIPAHPSSYQDLGLIEYVVRVGHLSPEALGQHDWPVAWVMWSSVIQVLGISMHDFQEFILWIPLVWQLFFFFPVFIFLRNTVGKIWLGYCWAGIWLFYTWEWTEAANLGAEAFGPFFFFGLIALLTTIPIGRQKALPLGKRVIGIILTAVLAATQLLISLVGLATVAILYILRRLTSQKLVVISAVFIAAWSMYGAATYFGWHLVDWVQESFKIGSAASAQAVSLTGNRAHVATSMVRVVFSAMLFGLVALGAFIAWKRRNNTYADITVIAIIAGSLVAAIVVGAGYGYELYQRIFLFILPAMVYFAVKLLDFRTGSVILCLFLVIALPLGFISRYSNQKLDYLSPAYYAASDVFHENSTPGYTTGIIHNRDVEKYDTWWKYERLEFNNDGLVYGGGRYDVSPHYISINDHTRQIYTYFRNKPQFIDDIKNSLDKATNCNLVFANADASLYLHERQNGGP